jgi:cysteine desulfurase/selenocysteine lyase
MNAESAIHPSAAYDVAALRRDFPIPRAQGAWAPLVYLDNAASAQKPKAVLDAVMSFMVSEYANVHRGVHFLSGAATERYEAARRRIQKFLNAAHEDEIIYTKAERRRSTWSRRPISRRGSSRGRDRAQRHGASLEHRTVAFPARAPGRGTEVGLTYPTRANSTPRMSRAPSRLARSWWRFLICRMCSARRRIWRKSSASRMRAALPVLADGCQGAVHGTVDVRALDVDFYAITGHKLYGPTGLARSMESART